MIRSILLVGALAPFVVAQGEEPASKPSSQPMGWTGVLDEDAFAALHELKEGAKPTLYGEDLKVGDARAYLSLPTGKEKPRVGVIVIHEWWGLNDHIRHWADRLAADGFAALAVDLYDGKVATTREEALASMKAVDSDIALETLKTAHSFLAERVKVKQTASIGWCFGGGWSLRLAMAEPELDAAVVYYGRLVEDVEQLAPIQAKMLGVFGDQDRGIPPRSVDGFAAAMEKAGKSLELRRYDANHAFANPSSARYDGAHARAAWREVRSFLRRAMPDDRMISAGRRLRFQTPAGWKAKRAGGMRAAALQVGEKSECYVVALRGDGGGLGPNLDRWAGQMGQQPLTKEELDALPTIPMLDGYATRVRFTGDFQGMGGKNTENAVMFGAVLDRGGEVLFVKMIGPQSELNEQSEAFDAFCLSLR